MILFWRSEYKHNRIFISTIYSYIHNTTSIKLYKWSILWKFDTNIAINDINMKNIFSRNKRKNQKQISKSNMLNICLYRNNPNMIQSIIILNPHFF